MTGNYVAGLPEASGTFTGIFDPNVPAVAELMKAVPDLLPVEIDTGDRPNPAAWLMTQLAIRIGGDEYVLPVDHVDILPGGNQVRAWVRRPVSSLS